MKETVKVIINVTHYFSLIGVILSGLIGAVYELIGFELFEKILLSMGLKNGFNKMQIVGFVFLGLLLITFIVKHFLRIE